VFEVQSNGKTL